MDSVTRKPIIYLSVEQQRQGAFILQVCVCVRERAREREREREPGRVREWEGERERKGGRGGGGGETEEGGERGVRERKRDSEKRL